MTSSLRSSIRPASIASGLPRQPTFVPENNLNADALASLRPRVPPVSHYVHNLAARRQPPRQPRPERA